MTTKPIASAKPETASLGALRSCQVTINDHKQGLHANDAEAFGCAHSEPAETSRAGHSGGVLTRAPGLFFRAQVRGSRPVAAQSRPHQCLCQITAGLVHQSSRLSSLRASRWVDPSEIGLTHAQEFFAPGAKAHD